ncbi:YqhA family protein [Egbenema bharatensis]|uniref:YqhA family protein n=1 Tax=Egbenema bharatensis TaxID=3463334 RepID=UPI003A889A40
MMQRLLLSSRYLINIAVITALFGSLAIIIDGVLTAINVIGQMFLRQEFTVEASKEVSIGFIEVIDLLFLGIVFYIFALGLYHLFIDSTMRLPHWLKIEDFEELKVILVSVVIVILTINFAGAVVEWNGEADILRLGFGVAGVIAAIGLILYVRKVPHPVEGQLLEPPYEETNH